MKRILIHIPLEKHGEYDIFSEQNTSELLRIVDDSCGGGCPNLGNRLWFQGLISEISNSDNQLSYFSPTMTKEYINSNFDMIIAPMANIFANEFQPLLNRLAERFHHIRIPVYVIACGIQANNYDQLNDLCKTLKESATKFISAVYDTGGEFALRGYFTKEFFQRLGFSSAVVTGCPSMYQLGRTLHISEEKVSKENFRPLINGNFDISKQIAEWDNAEFFDQGLYFKELWDPNRFDSETDDKKHLKRLIKSYGLQVTDWLLQDKIKMIPGMNEWREYLRHGKFSMSYGSRIHGSIMPILAGIPALLECRDARTREMAEFFHIPCVYPEGSKGIDLYELYQKASYRNFNEGFAEKFDAYEAFLQKYGIVEHVNEQNIFFHPISEDICTSVNKDRRAELYAKLQKARWAWIGYERAIHLKRKLLNLIKK